MQIADVRQLTLTEIFLYWIRERHSIYLKKERGDPKPGTDDEILRDNFFTNPYREHDKATQWFHTHVAEHFDVARKQAREYFDYLSGLAVREVQRTGCFVLPKMVKLTRRKRKARIGRNPGTGQPIQIPAKTVLKAKVVSDLKRRVLGLPPKAKRVTPFSAKKKQRPIAPVLSPVPVISQRVN